MRRKNTVLLLLAIVLAASCLLLDSGRFFSLDALQRGHATLTALHHRQPLVVAVAAIVVGIAVSTLVGPGVCLLALAGGAMFGFWWGTLLVSLVSALGATLAFLAGRYVFHARVAARWRDPLDTLRRGIHHEGARHLFMLRLARPAPFSGFDLVMGLTPLRTRTFYVASQLGMLAGIAVWANAGAQLAEVRSVHGMFSPGLLVSGVLLGLFPWLARQAVEGMRRRAAHAGWTAERPRRFDCNLVVIGAGAAGRATARSAAAAQARVTLVEAHTPGGNGLHHGDIPARALGRSARLAHQMRHGAHYGLTDMPAAFNFRAAMQRVQAVVARLATHDSPERPMARGVEVVQGHARITNPWAVEITAADGSRQQRTTRSIVIATGSEPVLPPLPGLGAVDYVTTDTLWEKFARLYEIPQRMVVLGGGATGCELAQSFARLGAQVLQVERAARLLDSEDAEVSAHVQQILEADGVQVLVGHEAVRCERLGEAQILVVEQSGVEKRLEFDVLVCAAGRTACLAGYGLEELGIPTGAPLETSACLQTRYPHIYAVGDVTAAGASTPAAVHQARRAATHALFGTFQATGPDAAVIPWTLFTDPEVARAGLNEQEARARGIACEVTRYDIAGLDRAITDGEAHGFVKVLTVPGRDRILGVTIVGSQAGELLAECVLAMQHGLGLRALGNTLHSHPTLAEAGQRAAHAWERAHRMPWLRPWMRHYHAWRRG